ncbi:MAG TPA: hypothetical protein VMT67_09910 [Terriglobales bacterium]|nr:hypothetical protein [Terriglobales bacterium]
MSRSLRDIVDALEASSTVSFLLNRDLHIIYCNPAWDRFAIENDGAELVRARILPFDLRRVLTDDLRPYYLSVFKDSAKAGAVRDCLYECSSPQAFRRVHMRIHPLQAGSGFLVTNAIVLETAHAEPVVAAVEDYLDSHSTIALCSHCRRSRRVAPPTRWDFVPAHLSRQLSNVTHVLCPICLEYFYPKAVDEVSC